MKQSITTAIVASFLATVVLSAIMMMKDAMGIMPELNVIKMLGSMMNGTPIMGWIGHFVIGSVVWGTAFATLYNYLPGKAVMKGMTFGAGAWLMMMLVVMPMAGGGVFGVQLGIMAPVMTLMLHLVFGAVLGLTFNKLSGQQLQVAT